MTPANLPLFPTAVASSQPGKMDPKDIARMRDLSTQLEAGFLSEMMRHAGAGHVSESFGGGIGEEQFTSFLTRMQAEAMAKAGGIGLAEQLFKAMVGGSDAAR